MTKRTGKALAALGNRYQPYCPMCGAALVGQYVFWRKTRYITVFTCDDCGYRLQEQSTGIEVNTLQHKSDRP